MVRASFRTREDGTLPTRDCGGCGRLTYQVPAGTWLHWGTLVEPCLEGVSGGQEGAMLAEDGTSTGEAVS